MFDWLRRQARQRGVEYIGNEVVALTRKANRIESVTLAAGEVVSCGQVVNASGTRGARDSRDGRDRNSD